MTTNLIKGVTWLLVGLLLSSFSHFSRVTDFPDSRYASYNWQSFQRLPELQQIIDFRQVDLDLLNAAVFYMTNRARHQQGLPALRFNAPLRNMASAHSGQMAKFEFVDHVNPYNPRLKTVNHRARRYNAAAHAENVASEFLHEYKSGTQYYSLEREEGMVYLTSTHDPIEPRTYLRFAKELLTGWMNSKGHRTNILLKDLKSMGCAVQIEVRSVAKGQLPMAYATQNFSFE
ncbi:MAG: CAP domain-containing protein [Bacteroidota bacterium]